jgi:hypothetical protein
MLQTTTTKRTLAETEVMWIMTECLWWWSYYKHKRSCRHLLSAALSVSHNFCF